MAQWITGHGVVAKGRNTVKIKELRSFYRKGHARAYAWPGGYPLYYVTTDGGALCPKCMNTERAQIFRSTGEGSRDGWAIEGQDVNWEDSSLFCDHCGDRIESAYAEDEVEQ